jgi:hypothetical protein
MLKKLRKGFDYRTNREKFIDLFIRCPLCKGEGGERDVILDDGSGPWYPCVICNHGYMNVFKKIYWKILLYLDEITYRIRSKKNG